MKELLVVANWKMNKTNDEAIKLVEEINSFYEEYMNKAVICPPLTSIFSVGQELKNSSIKLGAQNCCYRDEGAYTGEVSANMLTALDVEYLIVGHSERREHFYEKDIVVSEKFEKALEVGLIPILCVGETLSQRERNEAEEKVEKQLKAVFENREDIDSEFIIAYEPLWAIGTGRNALAEDAENMCKFIRNKVLEILGNKYKNIKILYGGSVKPSNMRELMSCENIDGALVGGASLKAEDFVELLKCKVMK